jgi:hypothetical protein
VTFGGKCWFCGRRWNDRYRYGVLKAAALQSLAAGQGELAPGWVSPGGAAVACLAMWPVAQSAGASIALYLHRYMVYKEVIRRCQSC